MASDYEVLLGIARRRRSTRRFKPDPIPDEVIAQIIEVARWAMSGANAQPWEFVVVRKPELRAKIFESYRVHRQQVDTFNRTLLPELRHPVTGTLEAGQPFFKDAPVIIAVCGDTRTLLATSLVAEIMGSERITYHMNMANATMLVHLAAASLGLASQWVSASPMFEFQLKTLLGVPEWFSIPQIVPIGYTDYVPAPGYRRESSEMVHCDGYDRSKFRTDDQVIEYIANLRKRSRTAYYLPKRKQ